MVNPRTLLKWSSRAPAPTTLARRPAAAMIASAPGRTGSSRVSALGPCGAVLRRRAGAGHVLRAHRLAAATRGRGGGAVSRLDRGGGSPSYGSGRRAGRSERRSGVHRDRGADHARAGLRDRRQGQQRLVTRRLRRHPRPPVPRRLDPGAAVGRHPRTHAFPPGQTGRAGLSSGVQRTERAQSGPPRPGRVLRGPERPSDARRRRRSHHPHHRRHRWSGPLARPPSWRQPAACSKVQRGTNPGAGATSTTISGRSSSTRITAGSNPPTARSR